MSDLTLSFFGLGHVGLVTAACFASKGFRVIGFDIDQKIVEMVNGGEAPFFEPSLDELLQRAVEGNFLKATTNTAEAILDTDITFITVGTPSKRNGSVDLSCVKRASKAIGQILRNKDGWHLVVVKSTVVPTTTERVLKPIVEKASGKHCGLDFGLCVNPEFLKEGSAVQDTFNPDRVVIGEDNRKSGEALAMLYREFYGGKVPPIIRTTPVNAELIKYTSNAFLAMKVSFINMLANLCQMLKGADVNVVAKGIGLDKRISPMFLRAGAGWGGPCFGKDLKAIKRFSESIGVDVSLLDAVIRVNEQQPARLVELAKKHLGNLRGKKVAVLGLAFKPNTDDIRDAPSTKVIRKLLDEGAGVAVYDPRAMGSLRRILGNSVEYSPDALSCIDDADCAIVVTEWAEFKKITPETFAKFMKTPLVVDGRRVYSPKKYSKRLKFEAIGFFSE